MKRIFEILKGYKTVGFNVVIGLFALASVFDGFDFTSLGISAPWAVVLTTIVNIILRFKTVGPVFNR